MGVGMRAISLGQEHGCAQIDGLTPELGEQLALNLDVLYVRRVRRYLNVRNLLIERELDLVCRLLLEKKKTHRALEISRRAIELLPLPLVHVAPNRVSVIALKPCVYVEQSLNVIVACPSLTDRLQRITHSQRVHRRGLSRLHGLNIASQQPSARPPSPDSQTRI